MRYLIRQGRLEARKEGGRWVIDRAALQLGEAQVMRGLMGADPCLLSSS
ncbi:MAG: hypothetical protein JXR96_19725 [Deltaproteobacteria bacterium]|nr:hypothetical protein [Deltaproteobacteria bacterium]